MFIIDRILRCFGYEKRGVSLDPSTDDSDSTDASEYHRRHLIRRRNCDICYARQDRRRQNRKGITKNVCDHDGKWFLLGGFCVQLEQEHPFRRIASSPLMKVDSTQLWMPTSVLTVGWYWTHTSCLKRMNMSLLEVSFHLDLFPIKPSMRQRLLRAIPRWCQVSGHNKFNLDPPATVIMTPCWWQAEFIG